MTVYLFGSLPKCWFPKFLEQRVTGMYDWGIKLDILAMPLTDLKYIHVGFRNSNMFGLF